MDPDPQSSLTRIQLNPNPDPQKSFQQIEISKVDTIAKDPDPHFIAEYAVYCVKNIRIHINFIEGTANV